MCALAHVLEREGIATVALVCRARWFPERMRPPRVLFCDFPMGRPLGRAGDADFQRGVLTAALDLLDAPSVPVLVDHATVIPDDDGGPLACPIPPVAAGDAPPSVAEARGLRDAYERAAGRGVTTGGDPALVEASLVAFERTARGTPWREAGFPRTPQRCALAVRGYYEQAALGLAGATGGARAAESWFVDHTIAGATLRAALDQMTDQGESTATIGVLVSTLQQQRPR